LCCSLYPFQIHIFQRNWNVKINLIFSHFYFCQGQKQAEKWGWGEEGGGWADPKSQIEYFHLLHINCSFLMHQFRTIEMLFFPTFPFLTRTKSHFFSINRSKLFLLFHVLKLWLQTLVRFFLQFKTSPFWTTFLFQKFPFHFIFLQSSQT